MLGDSHPNYVSLAFAKSRIGTIAVGLAARVEPLEGWIQQHHSGLIAVASGSSDHKISLSLTPEGVERFAPQTLHAPTKPELSADAAALASELRGSVYEELRLEAERRRANEKLYTPRTSDS